ncbi:hypothetical protein AK812_SmicGene43575 [Symbiodinium microadriaticum]|uniref:Uncharacterized protein n=1 Tax=Symbiodinium microadriaticum TaxID=2951 RepID=A0A1Q9C0N1_SYMMI|nr:hypothetical protein AK812_SmicGene43575 [Symbiodinium microadriaticum]
MSAQATLEAQESYPIEDNVVEHGDGTLADGTGEATADPLPGASQNQTTELFPPCAMDETDDEDAGSEGKRSRQLASLAVMFQAKRILKEAEADDRPQQAPVMCYNEKATNDHINGYALGDTNVRAFFDKAFLYVTLQMRAEVMSWPKQHELNRPAGSGHGHPLLGSCKGIPAKFRNKRPNPRSFRQTPLRRTLKMSSRSPWTMLCCLLSAAVLVAGMIANKVMSVMRARCQSSMCPKHPAGAPPTPVTARKLRCDSQKLLSFCLLRCGAGGQKNLP